MRNRASFVVSGALLLLTAVSVSLLADPIGASAETAAATTEYVLGIEGMSCPIGCAPKVKESLESLPGVRSVEVDFENKRAVVRTEPGVELTTEACDASFDNQGYFVSSIEKREGSAEPAGN